MISKFISGKQNAAYCRCLIAAADTPQLVRYMLKKPHAVSGFLSYNATVNITITQAVIFAMTAEANGSLPPSAVKAISRKDMRLMALNHKPYGLINGSPQKGFNARMVYDSGFMPANRGHKSLVGSAKLHDYLTRKLLREVGGWRYLPPLSTVVGVVSGVVRIALMGYADTHELEYLQDTQVLEQCQPLLNKVMNTPLFE